MDSIEPGGQGPATMMHLVAAPGSIGTHLAGWRHPDAWSDTVINWRQLVECARLAEQARFDLLFLADGNAVRDMDDAALFAALSPAARPAGFEPLTLLASIAGPCNRAARSHPRHRALPAPHA